MKKIISFLSVLWLSILLAGCSETTTLDGQWDTAPSVSFGTEWQRSGFNMKSTFGEKYLEALTSPTYQETGWQEIDVTKPDFAYDYRSTVSGCNENTLYLWHTYEGKEGNRFCFQIYRVAEQAGEMQEIILPEEFSNRTAVGMDIWGARIYILLSEEQESTSGLWVVTLDNTGKVCETLALSTMDADASSIQNFYVDGQGNYYLFLKSTTLRTTLAVYDKFGSFLFSHDNLSEENFMECNAFHTPDGSVIIQIPHAAPNTASLQWYRLPEKTPIELVKTDYTYFPCMTMTAGGMVYMLKTSQLVRWDVVTGQQELLHNFISSDIDTNSIQHISVTVTGDVLLYQLINDKWNIYILSDKEVEQEGTFIVLANMSTDDPYIMSQTAAFSRKNPEMAVFIEKHSGDAEAYRSRIMAELTTGKGPDLMWVTREDMQILQEKGVLMDLSQLISAETLEQIFPGILASGTIDGTLWGLCFDGTPSSYIVSNDIWARDTWTWEDICEIFEHEKKLKDIVPYSKSSVLYMFFLNDLSTLPFLDFESGISYFNHVEFIQMLETINQNNTNIAHFRNPDTMLDKVRNGELLTYDLNIEIRDLPAFSSLMKKYGNDCHLVVFENKKEYTGYWGETPVLVVNAKTQNKEAIGRYYEYLLSAEAQRNTLHCSIRGDIIERNVSVEQINGQSYGFYLSEKGTINYLELKDDGSTYLEEYLNFLNKCGPSPLPYKEIKEIIVSGANGYFNGQYTAKQAAELIHNRVQLYLDEQK